MTAPADAAAPAPDAAAGDEPDYSYYEHETIGPVRAKQTAAQLTAILGKPRSKSAPINEGATGMWTSSWNWQGVSTLMVSEHEHGPWEARDVEVTSKQYKTSRGIHVGSTRGEVERRYPRPADDPPPQDPDIYVVGSIYGGLMFAFKHDVVSSISLGIFAF